jgi:hypothetical protein
VAENDGDGEDEDNDYYYDDDDHDHDGGASSVGNQDDNERVEVEQSPKYSPSTLQRRRRRKLEQKIEDYIDSYQREKIARTEEPSCDDMDFFRSLLPLIKPLPLYQKMKFRMDVMKMAMEYLKSPVHQ